MNVRGVLITGAAGGLGRCFARALACPNVRLALLDVAAPALEDTAAEMRRRGAQVATAVADVADAAGVGAAVQFLAAETGGFDLAVHCAAVLGPGFWPRQAAGEVRRVLEVNFLGTEQVLRAAHPAVAQRRGRWIVLASTAALHGWPGLAAYSASKFAVSGFCEAIRGDLAACGVGLTVVYPLLVDTPMLSGTELPPILRGRRIPPERVVRASLRGAARGRKRVYVPRTVRLIALLHAVAPGLLDGYGDRFGRATPAAPARPLPRGEPD